MALIGDYQIFWMRNNSMPGAGEFSEADLNNYLNKTEENKRTAARLVSEMKNNPAKVREVAAAGLLNPNAAPNRKMKKRRLRLGVKNV